MENIKILAEDILNSLELKLERKIDYDTLKNIYNYYLPYSPSEHIIKDFLVSFENSKHG